MLADDNTIFTPKSESLVELLNTIHNHRTVLPNFQRPWVWEPDMVRDLLISVAYRYPAGSLLTMPITSASFALRPFEGAGESLNGGAKPNLMVLDGQQRLTSLYQALHRQSGVHVKGRVYHFYLDISVLLADPDDIPVGDPYFDKALFFVQEKNNKRLRYDNLILRYEISSLEQELDNGALPLNCLFDNERFNKWKQAYLLKMCNHTDMQLYLKLDQQWNQLVQPWLNRIRTYPFPVVELRSDMPLSAICHIFEKVNSTGVPLDVFDLCTAILWAQGFELNQRWETTRQTLQPKVRMQPLSGTYFLQGIALLDSLDRKRNIGTSINCRKQDLMNLKRETLEKWWPILEAGYGEAGKFMTDQGILAERILPYSTILMPLAAIFADLKHRMGAAFIGIAWAKITRWYWCSVFSQRYGSQVETLGALDFEQVIRWVDDDVLPDIVRTFSFRADILQEVTSLRNAMYKGVLCLLARNKAKDFGGGGDLGTALFMETRQDHHHIFPKHALKQLGITDPRLDTVINKTLINAAVNKSIGGHRPSQYVAAWRSKLPHFDTILESHLIDPTLLSSDNWDKFMRDRRERLRQLIADVCGGTVQPFSDTIEIESPDDEVIIV